MTEATALRRVALFQYDWPLQSHTLSLARALAAAGAQIDLYLRNCERRLVDLAGIEGAGIRVHDLSVTGATARLRDRIELQLAGVGGAMAAVPRPGQHDLYIGIEKRGLIWAGRAAERSGVPFVYYSLELYDDDYPDLHLLPGARRLRALERRYHARAAATLVQDHARADHLFRANGLSGGRRILLPVSVEGEKLTARARHWHERYNLAEDRPVLLYLGALDPARGCLDLAQASRSDAGRRFAFVFHGFEAGASAEALRRASDGQAFVSTDLVPGSRLPELVAAADAGIAFYRTGHANDELTAFSSEKVALYCQAGVPFIARDNASFRSLVAQFDCARLAADPADVPRAAEALLAQREALGRNAWRAFDAHFRFASHAARLIEGLKAAAG